MATLYFNGAVDNDWSTLGNWWLDDTFTTPATSLPSSIDDVIVSEPIYTNSGGVPTVANYTSNSYGVFPSGQNNYISINIIVTGTATFNGSSNPQSMTLTGNCIFNDSAQNGTNIVGNCTFNSASSNVGTIAGNCTFNDQSSNQNTITGNCTFNDTSSTSGYIEDGISTINFNDYAYNSGNISVSTVNFNNNSYNLFLIYNSVTNFNDNSYNSTNGHLNNGDHYFNDSSYNTGLIDGSVAAYWNGLSGTNANGTFSQGSQVLFFNGNASDNWAVLDDGMGNYNWWLDQACTLPAASIPDANNSVNLLSSPGGGYGNSITIFNLFVNNVNGNSESITVTGTATFNDGDNGGYIIGNCVFKLTSSNSGSITGACTFKQYAVNYGPITGDCTFNDYAFSGYNSSVSDLATFNDYSVCDSCNSLNDAVFNGASYCVWTNVNGNITFNDSAYLIDGGSVSCQQNVVFNDSSYYYYNPQINDNITFNGSVSFNNRTPYPIPRGINGSSILGII